MRFHAPARSAVNAAVFAHPIFAEFSAWSAWLSAADWPELAHFNAALQRAGLRERVVAQTAELLADGLHYETRIAGRGLIATREHNWHDLLNTLIWLRWPALKQAMNRRQVADIAQVGNKQRTRGQCALTHFDEAGVLVILRDAERIAAWDRHDWPGVFGGLPADAVALAPIGHALLEHALDDTRLLVGKALLLQDDEPARALPRAVDAMAQRITDGELLRDPQELRPFPLMGLPGWHPRGGEVAFLRSAECFQPVRAGRRYPAALRLADAQTIG